MSPSTPAEKAAKKVEKKREKDAKKQKQALASTPLKSSDDSKLAKKNEGDSGKGGENVRKEPTGLSPMKFATAAEQQLKQAMAAVEEAKEAIKQEQERARKEEETKRVGNEWDNFLEYLKVSDKTKAILLDDVGIDSIESLEDIADIDLVAGASQFKDWGINLIVANRVLKAAKFSVAGGKFHKGITNLEIQNYLSPDKGSKEEHETTINSKPEGKGEPKNPDDPHGIGGMSKATHATIDEFSGDPADFEDYWEHVQHRMNATRCGRFLEHKADDDLIIEKNNSKALFNILSEKFKGTTVEAEVKKVEKLHGHDGHEAAMAITNHYRLHTS